jgi:TatD DNase family protein
MQCMHAGGVVHSFTGSAGEAQELLGLHEGLLIGVNGCSLKTAENLEAVASVPIDRLALETDAPWCGCRPSHASALLVSDAARCRHESVDKKRHRRDALVKGRNEPCCIDQVRCVHVSTMCACMPQ